MKIAFDFITDETPLFVEVGKVLEKGGHKILGLTLGKRWESLWGKRFRTAPVSVLNIKDTNSKIPENVEQEMERIEQEYHEYHPASFLHADRFLCALGREKQVAVLVNTFNCVESFFKQEAPDIYFCTPIAYLFNLVTHAVCKRQGIPHLSIYTTRGSVPRFTFTTGVSFQWDYVNDLYQKYLSEASDEDAKSLQEAEEKLQRFRSSPHRPHYMKLARINYKFQWVFLKEFITRLKYYYLDGWGRDEKDYMTQTPFWYAWRDTKRLIRAGLHSVFKEQIFDDVDRSHSYYLFPLNVQPEAATLIYAEWNVDLISTIQNISRCIPLGTYLYVKEHTSAFGRRPLEFYNKIKMLHNVRLVGPWENADSLIVNSLGVIVLSSTMGWESLMHRKPTYVLGNLFCNAIAETLRIVGYDQLRQRIHQDFHSKKNSSDIPDASLVAFIAAIQNASYPGMFAPPKLDVRKAVLSEENVRQVAAGFKQITERLCMQQ